MYGREAEPHVGANVVLRRTPTVGVQRAEIDLRFVETLLRRTVVPLPRLRVVLGHALAVRIQ